MDRVDTDFSPMPSRDTGGLEIVRPENPRTEGDDVVSGPPAGGGQVRASALEASGSDATRSLADMIASLRAFAPARSAR